MKPLHGVAFFVHVFTGRKYIQTKALTITKKASHSGWPLIMFREYYKVST